MKKAFIAPVVSILAFVGILSSCSSKSEKNDEILRMLNEGLENSSKIINISTAISFNALKNKLADPATKPKAEVWYPKAEQISDYTLAMYDYLEKLKVKKHLTRTESEELFEKLIQYKQDLFAVDSLAKTVFEPNIIFTTRLFDSIKNQNKNFYKTFFEGVSSEATLAILNKFQNNIKIIENKMLRFCNGNIGVVSDRVNDDFPQALFSQNSTVFKAGETIEIKVGIGAFTYKIHPQIIIAGKEQKLTEMGISVYHTEVKKEPGKYIIPVIVSFADADGVKKMMKHSIEYTVMKECDQ